MTYTPLENSFRVQTITHGAFSFPDPVGGDVDEQIGWTMSRPGTRVSPATAMDSYGYTATAKCSRAFTPVVRATKATLTFTLLNYDMSTTGTVACANALAGEYKANFDSKPHAYQQGFVYSAGDTESLTPISIT